MAGPKGQQGDHSQQETALLAAAVVGTIAAIVIWMFYRAPIVYFVLGLNWLEVQFVALVHGGLGEVGGRIESFIESVYGARKEASLVKLSELFFVMDRVGYQVRFFVMAIILALAVWCLFRMRGEGGKFGFDLTTLAAYQARHWKVALAGSMFDPATAGEDQAPSLKPMDWIIKHGLPLSRGPDGKAALDQSATAAVFAKQLGETYTGLKGLPVYAQALAVAFNLSRLRHKACEGIKEKLTEIWTLEERPEAEKKTAELIAPYLADKKTVDAIEGIMGQHAFVNTALLGLFEEAKKRGGVFACAQILWLKKLDRTLWYTLQNVGRHACFIEGAGSRGHYFAEKVSGQQKVEPYVMEAVYGLTDYLIKHNISDLQEYIDSRKVKD